MGTEAVAGAAPYLQRAALTPHVQELARDHEVALRDLRAAVARATGTEPAKVVDAAGPSRTSSSSGSSSSPPTR